MYNTVFENNYTNIIEPIYGKKRNNYEDSFFTTNIVDNHTYSISMEDRLDMTEYQVYSIDPEGCEDADDAFSIYTKNEELFLAIHIADPTEYIALHTDLWNNIVERTTTKYPSNRKPIHMIPEEILKLSSLKGNNEIKKSISVITQIDTCNYTPIGDIKLHFSKIFVKSKNAYSYKDASDEIDVYAFQIGLKICKALQEIRAKHTKGVKLNELTTAYTKFDNGQIYLYQDSFNEKRMKQMIAEFAIFANSFVGEYLKNTLNAGIFRICEAKEWLNSSHENITGEEMIQQIITNGISADYLSNVKSHDLVGMPEYCHFTSPIRRLADCICHYLLKYIFLQNKNSNINHIIPFTSYELDTLSTKCVSTTKKDKKNQYLDIKFRLLQVMQSMIENYGPILLEYYVTGYSGLFLNIIICKINNFHVHMSYTLRVRNYNKEINPDIHRQIICSHVNCFTKYDQNCIPELDNSIL